MSEVDRIEVVVEASHEKLADDERFGAHLRQLTEAFKDGDVGKVTWRDLPASPGKKGGAQEIIIALGASGALGALVSVVKAWLEADKARTITIVERTTTKAGTTTERRVTATHARLHELAELMKK